MAFFEKKIRPALVKHCYTCHSAEAEKLRGKLLLDNRAGWMAGGASGQVIVPGEPGKSLLLHAIRRKDDDLAMPPKGKLPDAVIADFEAWIKMGAPDPREGGLTVRQGIDWEAAKQYWAFQPVRITPVTVRDTRWPRGPIDRYILARLEQADVPPAADAEKTALLRRATFGLTGLPPTPAEVRTFLKDDSPDAFAKVVDRLLASKQFGVHWGRQWLDGVRYRSRIGNIHVYRDWVVDSFNADKPYDRFLMEQIAGDLLVDRSARDYDPTPIVGTAALALQEGGCDLVERQLEVIGGQMLGMTLACARCHDHKFDPFTQQDYYALSGILQSSEIVGDGYLDGPALVFTAQDRDRVKALDKRWAELRKEMSRLQKKLPKQFQLVQLRRAAATGSSRQQDRLKKHLEDQKKNGWDLTPPELPRIEELIEEEAEARRELQAYQRIVGVKDRGEGKDVPLLYNGERSQPGDIVRRRLPVVFAGHKQTPIGELTKGSGRLELARWVASPDNPLTARVMANRVWLHLLGAGIVTTPNNFGTVGEKPSHPLLLDYLASELVRSGWSVKSLIRQIMLSRTYQLSARVPPAVRAKDLTNELFGRAHVRRLQYEQIADALNSVAGRLTVDPTPAMLSPRFNDKTVRLRTLYRRDGGLGGLFDGPEDDLLIPQRSESTTAPQMLYLLNSRDVVELAAAIAESLESDAALTDQAARVDALYLRLLGRPARPADVERATAYLASNPFARLCHTLLCSNEFVYVE